VLVDELNMPVSAQEDTEIVEPTDDTLKFDPINEEYGDWKLVLSNVIQKHVLDIL
jgi:hypothetical protein